MSHGETLKFWCNEITRGVSRSTGTCFQAKRPSFGAQSRAKDQKVKDLEEKSTGNSMPVRGAPPGISGGPLGVRRSAWGQAVRLGLFRGQIYIFCKVANFHILDHIFADINPRACSGFSLT